MLSRPRGSLRVRSGMLSTSDAGSAAELQRQVSDACGIDHGPGLGGDVLVRAGHDETDSNVTLSVGPLTDAGAYGFRTERCAVIFIREITLALSPGFEDHIRGMFDLTPAEARLAAALASGGALKDAASGQGIRVSTARSYLENIFRKTGTRQQSQLVALLKSAQPLIHRVRHSQAEPVETVSASRQVPSAKRGRTATRCGKAQ